MALQASRARPRLPRPKARLTANAINNTRQLGHKGKVYTTDRKLHPPRFIAKQGAFHFRPIIYQFPIKYYHFTTLFMNQF